MNMLTFSEASERNKVPILEVLKSELRNSQQVLEIGSGTGQHAVFFAANLPQLTWHTSDLAENHPGILERLAGEGLPNVKVPLLLDVEDSRVTLPPVDAVFSANTAHIMGMTAVQCMFGLAGRILPAGGRFCLYGPFNLNGRFTSDSNERFDASLKARDPAMGIRDLAELDSLADSARLKRVRLYAMPANNHFAVWDKSGETEAGAGIKQG